MKQLHCFLQSIKEKLKEWKKFITFPNVVICLGLLTAVIYIFSYVFPFTDNAFVVNNVRPVAAQVQGYLTDLYVKNGQEVKKGDKLFTVFQKPYRYTVDKLTADLAGAHAKLLVMQTTYARDKKNSENKEKIYIKLAQDDEKYKKGYAIKSVSLITLQNSQQETKAAKDSWEAALKQLEIDTHQITVQEEEIKSVNAQLAIAQVNLDLTEVRAENNGIVQNLFIATGWPVNINQPLFSLVDTEDIYIQANFNETDLQNVRKGDKVVIFPRMYLGRKIFHGVVASDYWSANRQLVDNRTQLQNVTNENEWILLPQRLPVIIKVTDPDQKFPLRLGASAYVYIRTV